MIESNSSMSEVFFALCKSVDTPVSLGAWLRYKHSHAELAAMDINPGNYRTADSFQIDYAVVSFLSKYKGLKTGLDLEDEAIRKFTQSETSCKETNLRLKTFLTGAYHPWLHGIHHAMQRKISKLLGPFSMFCVGDSYGWGPGATFELPRRRAFLDTKMCETPITVSLAARSSLLNAIEGDLHWSAALAHIETPLTRVIDMCRIETVPKNAKTHRVIAVEPRGNSFLQKGLGRFFRDRLRRVGVDLDDQGRNQWLASQAGLRGLCTIDLKSASDTVSKELVWALFPYDWASAMDSFRSRSALMPDKTSVIVLEKFSSMGNGFTFELESLIFWALISSIKEIRGNREEVAVYGDDLIVHRDIASEVCLALQFFGFTVNDSKSFLDGAFYESCGKHYFHGRDVTPAYQKEEITTALSAVRLGNRLIRLAHRLNGFTNLDSRIKPAWSAARRLRPDSLGWNLPFGSEGDDGWLILSECWTFGSRVLSPSQVRDAMNHGFRCSVGKVTSVSFPANDAALYAWSLRRSVKSNHGYSPGGEIEYRGADGLRAVRDVLPFWGELSRDDPDSQVRTSKRWVIPSGCFSSVWA